MSVEDAELYHVQIFWRPAEAGAELIGSVGLRDAFAIFDIDQSGTLTVDELCAILTQPTAMNRPLTRQEVTALVEKFDANGNGVLEYEEFVQAFSDLKPLGNWGTGQVPQVGTASDS